MPYTRLQAASWCVVNLTDFFKPADFLDIQITTLHHKMVRDRALRMSQSVTDYLKNKSAPLLGVGGGGGGLRLSGIIGIDVGLLPT